MSQLLDWYRVEQLPWPVNWPQVFGREAPLVVEIGFGNGEFLVQMAQRRPGDDFLGVEIALPSLRRAARKVQRAGLTNVRLVQGRAEATLQLLCSPGSVSSVYINFPDPWPKKAHQDRRVVNDQNLSLLASRLMVDAVVSISTDHKDYAEYIEDCLIRSAYFASCFPSSYVHTIPGRIKTKYERLAAEAGRPAYHFVWQRNDAPITDSPPILQEAPMPHIVFKTPASLTDVSKEALPDDVHDAHTHIRFLGSFRSNTEQRLLLEAYVSEEPIDQRVLLSIRPRGEGDMILELYEAGFPRPTPGIHRALLQVFQHIEDSFPDTVLLRDVLKVD